MNLSKDKYVIVEIIPNHSNAKVGSICQIQALKIDNLKLLDRFDYRLDSSLINNATILNTINYDNDQFIYIYSKEQMLDDFKEFIEDYPLILLESSYTLDYLKDIKNKKELVYPYLNMEHSIDVFDKIIDKYNLSFSNHLVDLIYEAIIYESNNK